MYDFNEERIRIHIGDGITTELADKVISLVAAGKVRFPARGRWLDFERREMEEMLALKPSGLSKEHYGELELHFVGLLNALQFHLEKDEVVVESLIHIVI